MDHVSVVVEDLEAAQAFFAELGLELEGAMPVEGRWVDRVNGLDNIRVEIAMMRTPDGHGKLELTKFPLAGAQRGTGERAAEHAGPAERHVRRRRRRGRRRPPARPRR
jgi:catechol 2,3-dioxygenase-like lactoylglutathione lyase family enzyme